MFCFRYDDEYYDKVPVHRTPVEPPAMWHPAQYENFEVRWNREPEWMPPPYIPRVGVDKKQVWMYACLYGSCPLVKPFLTPLMV